MQETQKESKAKVLVQLILVVLVIPLIPLLVAWRWDWWEAWVVALVFMLGFIISRGLAMRRHPDIIRERADSLSRENAKPWDRFLAPLMAFGGLFILLIAGLEERFQWTPQPYPLVLKVATILLMVLVYVFSSWALVENAYFSGIVRLQKERGHHVCDSGPYRFIRHPGYAGSLATYILLPLILDSAWAFAAVFLMFVVTVVRTGLEDHTLQAELPGYKEYAGRVKFRLFPGIW